MAEGNRYSPRGNKTIDKDKDAIRIPRKVDDTTESDNALAVRAIRMLAGSDDEAYREVCDMLKLSRESAAEFDMKTFRAAQAEHVQTVIDQAASI